LGKRRRSGATLEINHILLLTTTFHVTERL
jgi:hypothetical protein